MCTNMRRLPSFTKNLESNFKVEKKKKKKQKKRSQPQTTGLLVVDEDPMWQKPVELAEENNDTHLVYEEKPLVDEDIDVKRMKRLEQLRARRPYNAISEDGSGWVSLSSKPENSLDSNNDVSPPRKRKGVDLSPGQWSKRNDTPSPDYRTSILQDISPPRRGHDSPPQDALHGSVASDLSPPRKILKNAARTGHDSPPQDALHGSVASDLSPPRKILKNAARTGLPDISRGCSTEDFSPPRRGHRGFESSDLQDISPPRQSRHDSPSQDVLRGSVALDLSPPRKIKKNVARPGFSDSQRHSPQDLSPPRRSRHDSPSQDALHGSEVSDLSPPRKIQKNVGRQGSSSISVKVGSHSSLDLELAPPRRNTQESSNPASKTGLISGKDISDEIEKKKRDDMLRFNQMEPSISGRGAEPVYRDKIRGQNFSQLYLCDFQEIEIEWGKGLAQKREAEARLKELELEKEKPFARTRDDPELDKMFKERLRWGDPMAHLVKKKYPEPVLPNLGENEKMKESGFVVPQDIPNHSWLKRGLDAAPNRYGIRPGRHWDGVDRSNGFEKDMFKRTNERQARDREAYLWSVSDM
ncbi:pre-mRNA-splicing factor CWC26 [Vigna unguiculata]|uniref:Pre-mRNA-splicing factor CWC26 n=1 Tax=Vigna unguiculata TaxID=3917 RepID=A0A4D6MBF6_VIGUN|nr:pre-mRNA-splicing factor CWC26 [Vigna unguiculata]